MNTKLVLQKYGIIGKNNNDDSYTLLCPFHDDTTPSLSFNFVKRECGVFFCFSCHEHGDIFDLIAGYENCSVIQACIKISLLMKDIGIQANQTSKTTEEKSKEELLLLRKRAFNFYQNLPKIDALKKASLYAKGRGLTDETLQHFGIRYNVSSLYPIVFPLMENNVFYGYVARRIDLEKRNKYLNNTGFQRTEVLVGNIEKGVVLVTEGYLDMMMSYQHGMKNVCALLHWKISKNQAKKLAKFATEIVCGLDNDERGEEGYRELCVQMAPYGIPVYRLPFPPNIKDICEMGRESLKNSFLDIKKMQIAS